MADNPELNVLKNGKEALEKGYISAEDYGVVKLAFLKAQQIKAGVDAGFLREEDYERTRDAFLHSLDFTIHVVQTNKPGDSKQPASSPVSAPAPASAPVSASNGAQAFKPSLPKVPGNNHRTSGVAVPSPRAAPQNNTGGQFAHSTPPQSGAAPQPSAARTTGGTVPIDMSKVPKVVQNVPGQAMSGISVSVDCVNIFNFIKTRSSNKWVTFKIDDGGHQVVIDELGAPDSAFEDFVEAFPDDQCKYGVFDCTYNREGGIRIQKLVFFHWAPDTAQIRTKMMYASTKEFLKGLLSGVAAEVQLNDKKEFTLQLVTERIYDTLTRK